MRGLIKAELLRVRSRRLNHVLALSVAGVFVLVGVIAFLTVGQQFSYSNAAPFAVRLGADVLFTLAVVVGASSLGAEWSSGTLGLQLTWEPRRSRVLLAKTIAVAAVVAVATLVALMFLLLVIVPVAAKQSAFDGGFDAEWWRLIAGLMLKSSALTAIGTVLGVGLAGLMRGTAGPVTLWLFFRFIGSPLLTAWKPGWYRWLPDGSVEQFLRTGTLEFGLLIPTPSVWTGVTLLLLYSLVPAAGAFAVLRTRDVT